MKNVSEKESLNDQQISQMIEHIEKLDSDSQAVAVIDLEEAFTGTPMMDRPLWLRGMSHEAIRATRQQLLGTLSIIKEPREKQTMNRKVNYTLN